MIRGSIVALVTPMLSGGKIDYLSLQALLDLQLQSGTSGVVVGGTTGEASTLSLKEQSELTKFVVDRCGKNMNVIAGIGANSTSEAVELAAMAQESGAHAGLSVAPYYIRPNQSGIIQHFESVAAATGFLQILYNIPSRTSVDMANETVVHLSKVASIIGLKDATTDFSRASELMSACSSDFGFYSGDDATALPFMMIGGHGTISVVANVAPAAVSEMCRSIEMKNYLDAIKINEELIPLYKAMSVDTNPIPIKYLMSALGMISNELRLPLSRLQKSHAAIVESLIALSPIFADVERRNESHVG